MSSAPPSRGSLSDNVCNPFSVPVIHIQGEPVVFSDDSKGTVVTLPNVKEEDFEGTEVHASPFQIRHEQRPLHEINSAHLAVLKSSIRENRYDYRRGLITVILSGDGSANFTVQKAAPDGSPTQRDLKNLGEVPLVDGRYACFEFEELGSVDR